MTDIQPKTFSRSNFKPSFLGATVFDTMDNEQSSSPELKSDSTVEDELSQSSKNGSNEMEIDNNTLVEENFVETADTVVNSTSDVNDIFELNKIDIHHEDNNEIISSNSFSESETLSPQMKLISKEEVHKVILILLNDTSKNDTTKAWISNICNHMNIEIDQITSDMKSFIKEKLLKEVSNFEYSKDVLSTADALLENTVTSPFSGDSEVSEGKSSPSPPPKKNKTKKAFTKKQHSKDINDDVSMHSLSGSDEEEDDEGDNKVIETTMSAADKVEEIAREGAAEELAETNNRELSKRESMVAEMLERCLYRDKEALKVESEQARTKLQQKITLKVKSQLKLVRKETLELKKIKQVVIDKNLMELLEEYAKERNLNISLLNPDSEEEESDDDDRTKPELGDENESNGNILLSDDESDDSDDNGSDEDQPIGETLISTGLSINAAAGGKKCITSTVVANKSPRAALLNSLKRKSLNQYTQKVAEKKKLSTEENCILLQALELMRRRDAAIKAHQEQLRKDQERKERERKEELQRKREEEYFARQDDSEQEFDDEDEEFTKPVKLSHMTNDEELSDNSQSDEEDEDDEDVDLDEEAELRRLEELDKIASDNALKEQKRLEREAMKLMSQMDAATSLIEENREEISLSENIKPSEIYSETNEYPYTENASNTVDSAIPLAMDQNIVSNNVETQMEVSEDNNVSLEIEQPEAQPQKKKKPKSTMSSYQQLALEEESRYKQKGSIFIDGEAEEDEEEFRQMGLNEFVGFRIPNKEEDDEANALLLRKDDFKNIVDDVSDDEGDEEEGMRKRIEEEKKLEDERTKKVIDVLANGRNASNSSQSKSRGYFGIDGLTSMSLDTAKKNENEGGEGEGQEIDDEDEMEAYLSAGVNRMKERLTATNEEEDEELSDEDEEEDENVSNNTSAEDKLLREKRAKQEKEDYQRRLERAKKNSLLRSSSQSTVFMPSLSVSDVVDLTPFNSLSSTNSNNVMRKAVSMPTQELSSSGVLKDISNQDTTTLRSQSTTNIDMDNTSHSSLVPEDVLAVKVGDANTGHKRRTMKPPQKLMSIARQSKRQISQVNNVASNISKKVGSNASEFSGLLDMSHMEAGYGMGMAVPLSRRKSLTTTDTGNDGSESNPPTSTKSMQSQGGSIFSAVTGKRSQTLDITQSNIPAPSLQRTYSGVLSKRLSNKFSNGNSSQGVAVMSEQFIFSHVSNDSFSNMNENSSHGYTSASNHAKEYSNMGDSLSNDFNSNSKSAFGANNKKRMYNFGNIDTSNTYNNKKSKMSGNENSTSDAGVGGTSLFNFLTERPGSTKASKVSARGATFSSLSRSTSLSVIDRI